MKRKRKRFVEELERLLQEVKPGNYFFPYQRDTINFWWWNRKEPRIDINCGDGHGYITDDFSKTPLPILKVLCEKIKNKVDQGV